MARGVVRRVRGGVRELLAREVFDLAAHDGDAALVRGVELEHPAGKKEGPEEGLGQGEDGGGFARARGAVEEHVWELSVGFSCELDRVGV